MKKLFYLLFIGCFLISAVAQQNDPEAEVLGQIEKYEKLLEQNPQDFDTLYALGMSYHNYAAHFEKETSAEAVKYLKLAYAINPTTEVRSWLGSSYTLIARDTKVIIEKITSVQEGIAHIDGAIDDDPDNITARVVRVGNSLNLPEDFQRLDKVDKDFAYLFKIVKKDPDAVKSVIDPGRIFLYKAQYLVKENKMSQAYKFAKLGLTMAVTEEGKAMLTEFLESHTS